ncbi:MULTISPECIES: glycosyltransferase family 2 protein [Colwellia]|uniref:Glycosyltransferase n=1 Tax=Colwellia marinimaniae TaxID=1513592 RepID=A0ABQ0MT31_9GAMM|nr:MULTISPECIES: glycosyltransferase family 2 protein [Colwellia]GAW95533.1 putative glycosyltransferase [Colwellia marinimaniae]
MLVSIIIPVFNREHVLQFALDSIAQQTYTDWEIIVSDDGSTDNTKAIVDEFSKSVTQSVIFVEAKINQGVGCARNAGINKAKGDYIAFLDSDDRWLTFHLQKCIDILKVTPSIDWISANYRFIELDTNEVFIENGFNSHGARPELKLKQTNLKGIKVVVDPLLIQTSILHGHMAPLGSSVFRKKVFEVVAFPNARMHEDTVFWIDALMHKMIFGYIEDIHLEVFDHNDRTVVRELKSNQGELHKLKAHLNSYQALATLNKHKSMFNKQERNAYNSRLSNLCFWVIGYGCYLKSGRYLRAYQWFFKGISYQPFNKKYWKTFLISWLNIFR